MKSLLKNWYRFLHPRFQSLFLEYPVEMQPRFGQGKPPHPELYQLINEGREVYASLLQMVLQHRDYLVTIPKTADPAGIQPNWINGYLPGLDIATLYTLLVHFQPEQYVEVGSGNSTKVAAKAKREHQLQTRITAIDPNPRAEISQQVDQMIQQPFEKTDFSFLFSLKAGDILFIDNSHRVLPNSDATVFFLEVLPRLQKGVIVHIHDIYLPEDYPPFMCERFYSEQYLLAAFLLADPVKYKVLLPNYFVSQDDVLNRILKPLWSHPNLQGVEQHGGSFWLQIN